jgi:hypothetical protein
MCPGDRAQGEDHDGDDEAEGERDPERPDRPWVQPFDHDGARTGEDQGKTSR